MGRSTNTQCSDNDHINENDGVAVAIERSWRRSQQAGLSHDTPPQFPPLAHTDNPLRNDVTRRLIHASRGPMEKLWSAFGGNEWSIFLVDRNGIILHSLKSSRAVRELTPLEAGRRILESDIGTTAPSCTIAESRPVILIGKQHYLSAFALMSCMSVPILDISGQVIAALDITGRGHRHASIMMEYFQQASRHIENTLFANETGRDIIRFDYLLSDSSSLQGFISVDGEGQIHAANRVARTMLGLPEKGEFVPFLLDELLASGQHNRIGRVLVGQPNQVIQLLDGSRVTASRVRTAGRKYSITHKKVPLPDLKQESLFSIKQRLESNGGNISRTAKELNISRMTLYKYLNRG